MARDNPWAEWGYTEAEWYEMEITRCPDGLEHAMAMKSVGRFSDSGDFYPTGGYHRCGVGYIGTSMGTDLLSVIKDVRLAILRDVDFTCTGCGQRDPGAQVDHVRPRHAGRDWNLAGQIVNLTCLCQECNRVKSCYWPWHGYHPFEGADNPARADQILQAEISWLETRHGRDDVLKYVWGAEGEPGAWAYKLRLDGIPRWVAELYPSRYGS